MDPLSQAVVAATASGLAAKDKTRLRYALAAGVMGGLIPDLDIFIKSDADPLLALEYHRHFTHALAFIPIGGLIAALLCWPFLKGKMRFGLVYLFAALGYATHGLLDACTNYGTHLAWPLSGARVSWNLISIIDPIFTLTMLAALLLAFFLRWRKLVVFSAVFGLLYLGFGYTQKQRAADALEQLTAARGHTVERAEIKPSFANNIVWRAQYQYQGRYYMEGFRVLPFTTPLHYKGESVAALGALPVPADSVQGKDLARFAFFSDNWLAPLPEDANIIADMRFSNLPNTAAPLWAIRLNPATPGQPAAFVRLPRERLGAFDALWQMILGNQLPAANELPRK